MFKFKNYKKLYKIEKDNEKIILERKEELSKENIKLQKELLKTREEMARLKLALEDSNGFLEQEKQCSEELRKERKNLKTKLTKCINNLAEYNIDEAIKFRKSLEANNGKRN